MLKMKSVFVKRLLTTPSKLAHDIHVKKMFIYSCDEKNVIKLNAVDGMKMIHLLST